MEERDAQSVIRMVEANWHFDLGKDGRAQWREMLEPYDAETATQALATLAKHPLPGGRARPNVSDLRTLIVARARHEAESRESWRSLPPGPTPKPEWARRWQRARAEGDSRVLPEQIPGYLALQCEEPLNEGAYELPSTPVTSSSDWVQADEYAEIA